MHRSHLAIFFLLVLMAIIAAGIPLLRRLETRDRLRTRIRTTMAPYRRRGGPGTAVGTGVALAQVSQGIGRRLAQVFGFNTTTLDHYLVRWWVALGGALVCAFAIERVVTLLIGPLTLLAVLPLWVLLCRSFFNWCEVRRRTQLFNQFPDALAMIVRAVRVGIPVPDAIRAVGLELAPPTGPEFARIADELGIGTVLEEALRGLAERTGLPEYRFFATTLSLQSQTGGGLGETLDNLAEVIRKRVAVRERGAALSAEAKTSATVLALLPLLAGIGLWFLSPQYVVVLFTDPIGKKVLAAAVASLACGVMTMRMMIRRSLS